MLIIYAILILLSTINAKYLNEALWGFPQGRGEGIFTLYIYLLIFYASYKTYKSSKILGNLTTCAVLIISCVGVVQALIGRYFGFEFKYCLDSEYMAYGTMTNPNFFSTFITIFLPMHIIKYLSEKDNYNLYVIGIIFAGLVCSKSLGGYITFILYTLVVLILFYIMSKDKKEFIQKTMIMLLLFISIFTVLNAVNDNKYIEEFSFILNETKNATEGSQEFGNNRGYIWKICMEILSKNYLLGVGPDSLGREVIINYMDIEDYLFGSLVLDKAHNEYLHIAVTTGIPSLAVYIILILVTLTRLLKMFIYYVKTKDYLSKNSLFVITISASILAYLVQAFVNISVTCVAPMFWILLGISNKCYIDFKNIKQV